MTGDHQISPRLKEAVRHMMKAEQTAIDALVAYHACVRQERSLLVKVDDLLDLPAYERASLARLAEALLGRRFR